MGVLFLPLFFNGIDILKFSGISPPFSYLTPPPAQDPRAWRVHAPNSSETLLPSGPARACAPRPFPPFRGAPDAYLQPVAPSSLRSPNTRRHPPFVNIRSLSSRPARSSYGGRQGRRAQGRRAQGRRPRAPPPACASRSRLPASRQSQARALRGPERARGRGHLCSLRHRPAPACSAPPTPARPAGPHWLSPFPSQPPSRTAARAHLLLRSLCAQPAAAAGRGLPSVRSTVPLPE